MSESVSESVTQNELNALQIAIFHRSSTDLHQLHHGRVPGDAVTYCFWWKSEIFLSAKPEMELILTVAPTENIFNVKYLENGERHDVGLKGSQTGNHHSMDYRLASLPLTVDDLKQS